MKLGVKGILYDERTLRLENYLPTAKLLPPLREEIDNHKKISKWTVMGNLDYGDCVVAGAAHLNQIWTSCAGHEVIVPDEVVIKTYFDLTGGADTGMYLLSFLKWWTQHGFSRDPARLDALAKIGAFISVDPNNATSMAYASQLFGGVYMAFGLPLEAKDQIQKNEIWDVEGELVGKKKPWSWGGHCMVSGKRGPWGWVYSTWGKEQPATKRWHQTYCNEAYAILSLDWFTADHRTPDGLDWKSLLADLKYVTGRLPQ